MTSSASSPSQPSLSRFDTEHPHYKWVALSNTTLGMLMATINASIVIISLPAIFRGIHLDPLAPRQRQLPAVDAHGLPAGHRRAGGHPRPAGRHVRPGAGSTTSASSSSPSPRSLLALDPLHGGAGALWLIGWRSCRASAARCCSPTPTAILTDAFPADQRGMALGINQVAAHRRLVHRAGRSAACCPSGTGARSSGSACRSACSAPSGRTARCARLGARQPRPDRLVGQRDVRGRADRDAGRHHLRHPAVRRAHDGLDQPVGAGRADRRRRRCWSSFCVIETRVAEPMFDMRLFRIRAFAPATSPGCWRRSARGGLQFMLIIWLQGIWLPLHGYDFADDAAVGRHLPAAADRRVPGRRAAVGLAVRPVRGPAVRHRRAAARRRPAFVGLMLLPVDFTYWPFAALIALNGIGSGLFSAPNTTAIMNSVPAGQRGAASGMRGDVLQLRHVAVDRRVLLADDRRAGRRRLPTTLTNGLQPAAACRPDVAQQIGDLPPVGIAVRRVPRLQPDRRRCSGRPGP